MASVNSLDRFSDMNVGDFITEQAELIKSARKQAGLEEKDERGKTAEDLALGFYLAGLEATHKSYTSKKRVLMFSAFVAFTATALGVGFLLPATSLPAAVAANQGWMGFAAGLVPYYILKNIYVDSRDLAWQAKRDFDDFSRFNADHVKRMHSTVLPDSAFRAEKQIQSYVSSLPKPAAG